MPAFVSLQPSPEKQNNVISVVEGCRICYRPAFSYNYGTLSCDACKMFFRRSEIEKITFQCRNNNSCLLGFTSASGTLPKCKACRFRRCVDSGMTFVSREKRNQINELRSKKDDMLANTIGKLMYQNSHRSNTLFNCFTTKDPSLSDMIQKLDLNIYKKASNEKLMPQQWSFFSLYTTVSFLLDLDFMKMLTMDEQVTLLRDSATKCSLFGSAMRTYCHGNEELITMDGQDVYPSDFRQRLKLDESSEEFLKRIRCLVVKQIKELRLTNEEFVLVSVILFCNSALFLGPDQSYARNIVANEQQKYADVLLHYCKTKYQQHGPTRYLDLVTMGPVLQKNFNDLQYLTMLLRMAIKNTPIKIKNLVEELL